MSAPPVRTPMRWPQALGRAALVLWLPCLLPFAAGPLRECSHCVATYAMCLPIAPGVIVPVFLRLDDAWFGVVGGVATLLMLGALAAVLRRAPRRWAIGAQAGAALAVAAAALGFASLLRM